MFSFLLGNGRSSEMGVEVPPLEKKTPLSLPPFAAEDFPLSKGKGGQFPSSKRQQAKTPSFSRKLWKDESPSLFQPSSPTQYSLSDESF